MTPLGNPVVPEVYRIYAGSSGAGASKIFFQNPAQRLHFFANTSGIS